MAAETRHRTNPIALSGSESRPESVKVRHGWIASSANVVSVAECKAHPIVLAPGDHCIKQSAVFNHEQSNAWRQGNTPVDTDVCAIGR